jgi:hypothetical protein
MDGADSWVAFVRRVLSSVLTFLLVMSYPADLRSNLEAPLRARGKKPFQRRRMDRAIAYLNHVVDLATTRPVPVSTSIYPTDDVGHWESLFLDAGVAPPMDAIRAFVLHVHRAAGGRPVRAGAQADSDSSVSA